MTRHNMHISPETLSHAILKGNISRVKKFLAQGGDVNTEGMLGSTPLMIAAGEGHVELTRLLIDNGAHINHQGLLGETALMEAAMFGYPDVVRLLIRKGADLNLQSECGLTALCWAAVEQHMEIVALLIDKGADVTLKTKSNTTALDIARNADRKELTPPSQKIVKLLEQAPERQRLLAEKKHRRAAKAFARAISPALQKDLPVRKLVLKP